MKVICAGLSKTGTKSMARALRALGYKTYDYSEHVSLHLKPWSEVFMAKKKPDFLSMYSDVDALTALPPNAFYKEILETFPDAKVILTVRDSEDVWVESWLREVQLFNAITRSPFIATLITFSATMKETMKMVDRCLTFTLGAGIYEKGSTFLLKKKYREYNEQVKASVPSDQLLVFNVKQGWRPLCEFLGCNVPSCPFPRENVKGSFIKANFSVKAMLSSELLTEITKEILIYISLIILLVGIVLVMFDII